MFSILYPFVTYFLTLLHTYPSLEVRYE
jgi:hypothetical protein